MSIRSFSIGPYTGEYYSPWAPDEACLASLAGITGWFATGGEIASLGRHSLVRHELPVGGRPAMMAVKSFSRGAWLRDVSFRKKGSKARRSFMTAVRLTERGVGTPKPFAYLDHWDSNRLLESYYLCEYQENITSFRDELNRLYAEDPLCRRIMTLMEAAALAIADMHDAGVFHRDLGNQNILLRRLDQDAWGDVQFIDLNRAQVSEALTMEQRARDLSRIDLPSDFLRVFKCMYFRHQHPPAEFHRLEDRYRRRFALHTATRKYRHPIREAKQRKKDALLPFVPRGRELWVWDDRSIQAVSTLLRRERHHYYHAANHFHVARGLFASVPKVWRGYRDYLNSAFSQPVNLSGRIGVAVGAEPGAVNGRERPLLERLGTIPVLLRFYRHETDAVNEAALAEAQRLRTASHSIFAALVQDRAGLREPAKWNTFVEKWVPALRGIAGHIEVGHAINRVKWGLWDIREYRSLLEPVTRVVGGDDSVTICGPAVIDFEYHYLAGVLEQIRDEGCLGALSHHLYVDRRGAPENRQGRFSCVEKFALAKAFAAWSRAVKGDRFIVSEVNWPILGTGEYSPVNSPYIIPGSHTNDPSVDEETYADYMIRYYALALCSGLVDQVYWWRLVARGFGLVDDTESTWRIRPAYRALEVFIRELGDATFIERVQAGEGVWILRFDRPGRRPALLAWAHPEPKAVMLPLRIESSLSRDGEAVEMTGSSIQLSGRPCYLIMDV